MLVGRQLLKNIFTSWAGFALRVGITFFFTPFITRALGEERYGAWVVVFATLDYLSMADLGMKQSLVRFISKALGEKRMDRVNGILNTATLIYIGLATITMTLALIVVANLGSIVTIPSPELLQETKDTLLVITFEMVVFFLLLPFANTLGAFHRFDISNMQNMVAEAVRVIVLVYLLKAGYGLVALVWAIFVVSLLRQIWSIITLKRMYPEIRLQMKSIDKSVARDLLGYSKISFLITIMWLVIFRADAYILGGLLTVAFAGIYAPAGQIFYYIRNLINSVGTPLVPAVSHLESTGDTQTLANVYLKGLKYVSFGVTIFSTGCLFYAHDFIRLWLAPAFAPAGDIMMVLAIPAVIFMPQIVGNSIMFGLSKHNQLLKILLAEGALKIILSIVLVKSMGMIGLAYGTGIPQVLLYGFVYPQIICRIVKIPVGRVYLTFFKSVLLGAVTAAPIAALALTWLPPTTWLTFFGNVTPVVIAGGVVGYFLLEPDDKLRLLDLVRSRGTSKLS